MLKILSNGDIHLTRGDTAKIQVDIINDLDNNPYILENEDILEFSVKLRITDEEPIIYKKLQGTSEIYILPEDTKNLSFIEYYYDIQLTTSSGDIYTIIGPCKLKILAEITR